MMAEGTSIGEEGPVKTAPRVAQINVSPGGVPKLPVETVTIGVQGLDGDGHRDHAHHGGPDRAVCLFSLEAIEALQAEGHPIAPGTLGENLTVHGLDWPRVTPGRRLRVGPEVVLEVTRYTSPCVNITRSFLDGDYARVSQKRHPGWSRVYARVLVAGRVRRGDAIDLADEPAPAPAR
jgi:MOSC domain-containing protein YiiM